LKLNIPELKPESSGSLCQAAIHRSRARACDKSRQSPRNHAEQENHDQYDQGYDDALQDSPPSRALFANKFPNVGWF
jgi:hypothetical protein